MAKIVLNELVKQCIECDNQYPKVPTYFKSEICIYCETGIKRPIYQNSDAHLEYMRLYGRQKSKELSDNYVAQSLKRGTNLSYEDIEPLIEIKRLQLKLKRQLR